MVSDVSAMMNTVSQASNRPSSERPQQTDSYHDMMKNMLKEQKRIKEEKKGEAGKGGRKFKNIHWNIGGRCATMSEIRRKAGGRTWII